MASRTSGSRGGGDTPLRRFARRPIVRKALPVAALAAMLSVAAWMGDSGRNAALAALSDPASLLAQRSPGARAAGALTQTKLAFAPTPEERVLSQVRQRSPLLAGLAPAPLTGLTPGVIDGALPEAGALYGAPTGLPLAAAGVPSFGGAGPPSTGGFFAAPGVFAPPPASGGGSGGGGGVIAPPGGGTIVPPTGGTGTPPGNSSDTPPGNGTGTPPGGTPGDTIVTPPGDNSTTPPGGGIVPPVSVVPEPASWALMVLGFGLVGGLLRRRPVATAAVPSHD